MKAITERHVQAIWYDVALRPRHLTTRNGSDVVVITPGEWNLGAGPDFRNAVLEIGRDRRRVVGDVEVHLCPNDWDLHGHGVDPRYRNVVAHVTWGCGPVPSSLPSGAVSIWLGRFVTSDPSFDPGQIDLMAYPYARLPEGIRPCEDWIGHDPDRAHRLLDAAGRHRLRMKARRIVGRLCAPAADCRSRHVRGPADRRQVFYEEVMTALGYVRNQIPFRHVAERVPISALPSDGAAARTALLTAGSFEEWDRTSHRPNNSPERRLARAGDIFTSTPTMCFAEARDFSRDATRAMVTAMCGERCLGRGRAAAILANVIVPFAMAEGRVTAVPDWLPPEDVSSPVRLTAFRLFGRDHNPAAFYSGNGLYIQGLLQIHRDYCLQTHPDCAGCGVADLARDQGEAPLPNAAGVFMV